MIQNIIEMSIDIILLLVIILYYILLKLICIAIINNADEIHN